MDIKVLVATHKKYRMPKHSCYLPIHVGKEGKEDIGYIGDNTGDNISYKNANYCELSGLYWGSKNLNCDYLGLVHYRRHFSIKKINPLSYKNNFQYIISEDEIKSILEEYDLIVPTKRRYYIETLY